MIWVSVPFVPFCPNVLVSLNENRATTPLGFARY